MRRRSGRPVDWDAVRERLAAARAATEAAAHLPPDRARALLEERARAFARVPPEAPDGEVLEVVTFVLGGERYAIETRCVREVLRVDEITRVPGVPDFVRGLTNVRGELLAIVDLARFLGARERGLSDLARIVVLGRDEAEFGILADSVEGIAGLRADEILARVAPGTAPRLHVRGVTREALIVLDGAALLSDSRLTIEHGQSETPERN